MEALIWLGLAALVCLFLVPLLLFRPLLLAIAQRISPKQADAGQLKAMQNRLDSFEQQLEHMHVRLSSIEETSEFSRRLLQDLSKKPSHEATKTSLPAEGAKSNER